MHLVVLQEYFDVATEEDRQARAGRQLRYVKNAGDRRVNLRERTKVRGDARDRKHADHTE